MSHSRNVARQSSAAARSSRLGLMIVPLLLLFSFEASPACADPIEWENARSYTTVVTQYEFAIKKLKDAQEGLKKAKEVLVNARALAAAAAGAAESAAARAAIARAASAVLAAEGVAVAISELNAGHLLN